MVSRRTVAAALGVVAVSAFIFTKDRCLSARLRYGVDVAQCPDGDVFTGVSVSAHDLRRGQPGSVTVDAAMLYALPRRTDVMRAPLSRYDATLALKRDTETITIVVDDEALRRQVAHRTVQVTLPKDLSDGDYTLVAEVKSAAGQATASATLPVYAPAKVHVVTDRPLYEPGNTVMFRAVVVRARDLVPLDGRPGRFQVYDPRGVLVFDERHDAGAFGVAAAELPLDPASPAGDWRVRYTSGNVSDDVTVAVRPFQLPRFSVTATADKGFYGKGEEPRVRVQAKTAAGVPMAATVRLSWRVAGEWPAPPEWLAKLPEQITLPSSGTTTIAVPAVPADLQKKAQLIVTATAADDSGDEETGGGAVLLAEDKIDVAVVTELGQGTQAGLVEGKNNRVYLRVTTADGAALPGATLRITRAWDPKDKGQEAVCDEDSVCVVQLDPGPAVNIVVPPMPVRLPPPPPEVERTAVRELANGAEPTLRDLQAMDTWNASVAPCSRFIDGSEGSAEVTLQVSPGGSIDNASADDAAGRCARDAVRGRTLPAGAPRIYVVGYTLRPPTATIDTDARGTSPLPGALAKDLAEAMLDARVCVGRTSKGARLPQLLSWQLVKGRWSTRVYDDGDVEPGERADAGVTSCVLGRAQQKLREQTIESARDEADRYGVIRFVVNPVDAPGVVRAPQATTQLGYELRVAARVTGDAGRAIGDTKIFVEPGAIPALRLRAQPAVAVPGATVTVDLVRGPDFVGPLPQRLTLSSMSGHSDTVDVDPEKNTATFTLPKDQDGWFETSARGATARVFVPRQVSLAVKVGADKPVYKPGEQATVSVTTTGEDGPVAAAVGLFGVDETLGLLAPLLPPSAYDRLSPAPVMREPAFGVLDAMALSLGRVRGEHAAAATVLFVQSVPQPSSLDTTTAGSGASVFEPTLPLADRFYGVLEALHGEVRRFEETAPKEQKLTPKRMLELWDEAIAKAKAKGVVTTDVFGRPLRLQGLPDQLVAMCDPHVVVRDGARLNEDIEAWIPLVRSTR